MKTPKPKARPNPVTSSNCPFLARFRAHYGHQTYRRALAEAGLGPDVAEVGPAVRAWFQAKFAYPMGF